jgi:hypothetical protein
VKHIVQFSTGAGSAEVAFRVVERYGVENVHLLTADTLVEDEDNWRFAREVVARLDVEWSILADGRTPMEVGRDERCVPNNRLAVCSRILKRKLLRSYIDNNFDPANTVMHLGYGIDEEHRIAKAREPWAPYTIDAPLTWDGWPPFLLPGSLHEHIRDVRGIEPPRLYAVGFPHANCGGACVRGGQRDWARLLGWNRDRYLEWEAEEDATRAYLGKDVTILRDRRGGPVKPLPLSVFRRRLEGDATAYDEQDTGACGCAMLDEAGSELA